MYLVEADILGRFDDFTSCIGNSISHCAGPDIGGNLSPDFPPNLNHTSLNVLIPYIVNRHFNIETLPELLNSGFISSICVFYTSEEVLKNVAGFRSGYCTLIYRQDEGYGVQLNFSAGQQGLGVPRSII